MSCRTGTAMGAGRGKMPESKAQRVTFQCTAVMVSDAAHPLIAYAEAATNRHSGCTGASRQTCAGPLVASAATDRSMSVTRACQQPQPHARDRRVIRCLAQHAAHRCVRAGVPRAPTRARHATGVAGLNLKIFGRLQRGREV